MKKAFDCVAMKHPIQERQTQKLRGLSPTEESRFMQAEIAKDPALAVFCRTSRQPVAVRQGEVVAG